MKKSALVFLGTLILGSMIAFVPASSVWAGADLHIGDPPNSGGYLFNDGGDWEVRPISNTSLGILENGNGNPTLVNPLLLILGVPDMSTFAAPDITLSSGTGIIGGTNAFSGAWNTVTGYAGEFDSSASGDVYSFIGLPGGNNSNSFGNWHDADLAVNGIDAAFFGIYVYTLTNTGISGGETVDVTFASAIPNGVFAVAYGQYTQPNGNVKKFSTPFTEAGLTIPEPGTVMLLGSGLLGLVLFRRKFRM